KVALMAVPQIARLRHDALVRWLVGMLAAVLLVGASAQSDSEPPDAARTVVRVYQADLHLVQHSGELQRLGRVALPHAWDVASPPLRGTYTYRAFFTASDTAVPLAMYLPRAGNVLTVLVNGRLAAQVGTFGNTLPNYNLTPHWITLPAQVTAGSNQLDVVITGAPLGAPGLADFYIGPQSELRPMYERRWLLQNGAITALFSLMIIMAFVAGLLWWHTRTAPDLWFAAASLAWAGYLAYELYVDPPLPATAWYLVHAITFHLFLWLLGGFLVRLAARRTPFLATTRTVHTLCMAAGILAECVLVGQPGAAFAKLLSIAPTALTGLGMLIARRQERSGVLLAGALSSVILVASALWDLLSVQLSHEGYGALSLSPFVYPVLIVVMALTMVARLAGLSQRLMETNKRLEIELHHRTQELRGVLESLHRRDKREALSQERERIAQEMHDGPGSELVSALALLDRSQPHHRLIADAIERCLLEMKSTVDLLALEDAGLSDLLAAMRYRLQPALERLGIHLSWHMDEDVAELLLAPEVNRHLARVVQEALSNVIQHSNASNAQLSCEIDRENQQLVICVLDDGDGLPDSGRVGRGLQGMRQRAQQIGAALALGASALGGASVRLTYPINALPH
ncbi:MAG TPA: ATP-binding protein, partial [Burkholderiaceae bacterium]|nr:ATP-binding protein [Burkholderiaceae bacterium]